MVLRARTAVTGIVFALLAAVTVAAQESGGSDPLMAAFQKEFVFLDNEARLLRQRIEEVEQDGERRVAEAQAELQELEAQLLRLRSQVDRRSEELRIVDQERSSAEDATDTVTSIITQATLRLENNGISSFAHASPERAESPTDVEKTEAELAYVFDRSFDLLHQLQSVRDETGRFYLKDGTQVEGTLVHIGAIASFGVSDQHGGTLAPAGGGELRLADESTAPVARELAAGNRPPTLPLFLYESLDRMVETAGGKTIRDTIEGGGIIGIVIIAIGAVAALLVVLRAIFLAVASRGDARLVDTVVRHVHSGSNAAAAKAGERLRGPVGRVLRATVRGLQSEPKKIDDAISESILNEQPQLERFASAISVFAAVAPLLGLLGTVTGMIATFDIITEFGTGDPKLLSGGISEALITTELGLIVAIPTLLIGNLLTSWSDRIVSGLEISALRIVNASNGNMEADTERERAPGAAPATGEPAVQS
jgi:biopolymer transport protein ExbB